MSAGMGRMEDRYAENARGRRMMDAEPSQPREGRTLDLLAKAILFFVGGAVVGTGVRGYVVLWMGHPDAMLNVHAVFGSVVVLWWAIYRACS